MSKNEYTALEHGCGIPLVMLHGMMGRPQNWAPLFEHLPADCRAIALRFPFFDDGVALRTVEAVEGYLLGFLDAWGLQEAVLCGNSLGGHVGLDLAARLPARVRGLVLTGSGGLFERSFGHVSSHPPRQWVYDRIREIFHEESHVTDELVDEVVRLIAIRRNTRDLVAIARSAKRDNVSDRLGRIACPALLVWGRQDRITPPDVAEEMTRLIPRSELVWLEECGHAPMIERPREFGQAVGRWWERNISSPPRGSQKP
jgi:pimeloyl-ACP methyl ester carboxylesterase